MRFIKNIKWLFFRVTVALEMRKYLIPANGFIDCFLMSLDVKNDYLRSMAKTGGASAKKITSNILDKWS